MLAGPIARAAGTVVDTRDAKTVLKRHRSALLTLGLAAIIFRLFLRELPVDMRRTRVQDQGADALIALYDKHEEV